jgi:hypothetical protein
MSVEANCLSGSFSSCQIKEPFLDFVLMILAFLKRIKESDLLYDFSFHKKGNLCK